MTENLRGKVLIVDKDEGWQRLIGEVVTECGFTPVYSRDSSEALAMIDAIPEQDYPAIDLVGVEEEELLAQPRTRSPELFHRFLARRGLAEHFYFLNPGHLSPPDEGMVKRTGAKVIRTERMSEELTRILQGFL